MAPYTPQQNGVVERKNRALKEIVNAILSFLGLSDGFWEEAMAVVRLPDPKRKTLGEKGSDCIFVGYAKHSKACRFYVIEPNDSDSINIIIESRDAKFDENCFSSIPRPKDIIPNLDESQRDDYLNDVPIEVSRDQIGSQYSYYYSIDEDLRTYNEAMLFGLSEVGFHGRLPKLRSHVDACAVSVGSAEAYALVIRYKYKTLVGEVLSADICVLCDFCRNNPEGQEYPFDLSKPQPLIEDRGCQVVPIDYFINNDLEYLKGIEDTVPSLWSPVKVAYDRYVIWGITHWVLNDNDSRDSQGNMGGEIEVRREDHKRYKFKEGDFQRLNLRDIEDMMLLLVQNKISNLERDVIFDLNVALQMLMRLDELYKFCDGTLTSVRSVLHDIASNLRMDYLPKRRWSKLERKRSRIIIKIFVLYLLPNLVTMADANINAPEVPVAADSPPTRSDEQILPRNKWVPVGKSNCFLDVERTQANPIFKIAVDILKNTNFFKAFTASSTIPSIYIQQFWDTIRFDKDKGYSCQLDEQRFYLTKSTLRDALQLP
ncbi:zinc finger, CCHC-type containing protein [Tanacetum coccineum]